jgi:hypothetical protein
MSGLGGSQDLYDHTQQSHMGMELQQHLHQSHMTPADVMRPHHGHDMTGSHGNMGGALNSHFVGAGSSGLSSSNSLRSSPFLTSNDTRGTQQQQRSYYGDDTQQHGHQVMHSHDVYGSQIASHQQQQHHQHQHMFANELHQQQQQQQQQHSRSILTNQDYQSHLLGRHYRDQDMDPSGGDDVNMGEWN